MQSTYPVGISKIQLIGKGTIYVVCMYKLMLWAPIICNNPLYIILSGFHWKFEYSA